MRLIPCLSVLFVAITARLAFEVACMTVKWLVSIYTCLTMCILALGKDAVG